MGRAVSTLFFVCGEERIKFYQRQNFIREPTRSVCSKGRARPRPPELFFNAIILENPTIDFVPHTLSQCMLKLRPSGI